MHPANFSSMLAGTLLSLLWHKRDGWIALLRGWVFLIQFTFDNVKMAGIFHRLHFLVENVIAFDKDLLFKRQLSARGDGWEIRRAVFWKEAMVDGANSAMSAVLSFSSALNQSRKYVYHLY